MIVLSASPAPQTATPRLLDFGAILRPATGAGAQRINRPGNRWQWQVAIKPLTHAASESLRAALSAAREEGLRMFVPLSGRSQGSPGTPLVNGAGQSGKTLVCDGFTASYQAKAGYWFSVADASGTNYLHKLTADVTASGAGAATLSFIPALRAPIADNAAIQMVAPVVEGIITSDVEWELNTAFIGMIGFTLEEMA